RRPYTILRVASRERPCAHAHALPDARPQFRAQRVLARGNEPGGHIDRHAVAAIAALAVPQASQGRVGAVEADHGERRPPAPAVVEQRPRERGLGAGLAVVVVAGGVERRDLRVDALHRFAACWMALRPAPNLLASLIANTDSSVRNEFSASMLIVYAR